MYYISKIFKKSITNKIEVDLRFTYGGTIVFHRFKTSLSH